MAKKIADWQREESMPSRDKALTGGLAMVMTATPSPPTAMETGSLPMDARSRGGLGSRRGRYEEDAAKKTGGDAGFFIGVGGALFF